MAGPDGPHSSHERGARASPYQPKIEMSASMRVLLEDGTQECGNEAKGLEQEHSWQRRDDGRNGGCGGGASDWVESSVADGYVEGATIVEMFSSPQILKEVSETDRILPGLKDNRLALLCLARLRLADRVRLRLVSKLWMQALTGDSLYSARYGFGFLEESFVALMFSETGPYLRAYQPSTGTSFRLPHFQLPPHISDESLRLSVAGRVAYLYSTERASAGFSHLILAFDLVKYSCKECTGLGAAGRFLVAAADWVSGQLFVASNDVNDMTLGRRPDCDSATVAVWDTRTQLWEHCPKLPPWLRYSFLARACSGDGKFLLFLIEVVSGTLRAVQYDPLDRHWSSMARFPTSHPEVTCLNGVLYGLSSGVVWQLAIDFVNQPSASQSETPEETWLYFSNVPRHVTHCRVHNDCKEDCQTISHCEELIMALSGKLCVVRSWLSWVQGKWTVKSAIHLLDPESVITPPVPRDAWELLDISFDDKTGMLASCGVAIT